MTLTHPKDRALMFRRGYGDGAKSGRSMHVPYPHKDPRTGERCEGMYATGVDAPKATR